jgi:hypothetical protein
MDFLLIDQNSRGQTVYIYSGLTTTVDCRGEESILKNQEDILVARQEGKFLEIVQLLPSSILQEEMMFLDIKMQ